VLTIAAAERVMQQLLRDATLDAPTTVSLLDARPGPWSAALSRTVISRLRAGGDKVVPLLQSIPTLAVSLDPSVAPDLEAWIGDLADADTVRRQVRQLAHALTLRASIAKELS
jgi:hypothetical protein